MIKIGPALLEHVELLERERGIPKDVTLDALKEAMLAAYKRYAKLPTTEGYECRLIERSGEIGLYLVQEVVDALNPELAEEGLEHTEITLKEARKLKADAETGDILEIEVTPDDFGRIAAQSAKQVITQRIREAEKMLILKEFEEKKGQVTTGIVQRIEGRNVIVNIGKSEAFLPPKEQLPGEYYRVGNKLRVFVSDIRESGRVPQIIVSQAHPQMVREVFELEVPEIEDGIIVLNNIAREAGFRTKVAVSSTDPEVDPQGACIGTRGSRIQAIVNELKNEKIDIIRYSDDPVDYIVNALAPAKIVNVYIDFSREEVNQALVVVPDDQLSLAIGRDGQNVRLAAKLTGYKLDIKSINTIENEGLPLHIYEQYYGDPEEAEAEQAQAAEAAEAAEAAAEAGELAAAEEAPEGEAVAEEASAEAEAEAVEEAPEEEAVAEEAPAEAEAEAAEEAPEEEAVAEEAPAEAEAEAAEEAPEEEAVAEEAPAEAEAEAVEEAPEEEAVAEEAPAEAEAEANEEAPEEEAVAEEAPAEAEAEAVEEAPEDEAAAEEAPAEAEEELTH